MYFLKCLSNNWTEVLLISSNHVCSLTSLQRHFCRENPAHLQWEVTTKDISAMKCLLVWSQFSPNRESDACWYCINPLTNTCSVKQTSGWKSVFPYYFSVWAMSGHEHVHTQEITSKFKGNFPKSWRNGFWTPLPGQQVRLWVLITSVQGRAAEFKKWWGQYLILLQNTSSCLKKNSGSYHAGHSWIKFWIITLKNVLTGEL